jgi:chemotaxis protein histidine kinase CheA
MAPDDEFESFKTEYRNSLPKKMRDIDDARAALEDHAADVQRLRDLMRMVHSIAGSARTFGVDGLSEAAAAAEAYIEPWCDRGALPAAPERAELDRLLAAVHAAAGC